MQVQQTAKNKPLSALVMGLMSGTSVDAVDVAICRFSEDGSEPGLIELEVLYYAEQPYPAQARAAVFGAFGGEVGPARLCELNFELGEVFAQAALDGLGAAGIAPGDLDLIASHGQTIYHQVAPDHTRSTLQMAEAALIAARTGLSVANDFRPADMAVGGQGAPLVPYFDLLFFADPHKIRALQNIGGIGNVTFLPTGATAQDVLAFDTGPGNALLDFAARHFSAGTAQFDQDGQLAGAGRIHAGWLAELLAHPYFALRPPKSTGRELFGDAFARAVLERAAHLGLPPADTLATLTALTAKSIAGAIRRFSPTGLPTELIVSGGGARNPVLMEGLAEWLPGVEVKPHDAFGVRAEAKEAVAFALLGYELLRNRPANLPGCTGASRPTLLGKLTPGSNWAALWQKFGPAMLPSGNNSENEITKENQWPTTPRLRLRPT